MIVSLWKLIDPAAIAFWVRIRKELGDTRSPHFQAILMACCAFFAPRLCSASAYQSERDGNRGKGEGKGIWLTIKAETPLQL